MEIIEDYRTDTYRAVYTVKFAEVAYGPALFSEKIKERN